MSSRIPTHDDDAIAPTHLDRRVRKSQQALKEAFISLTLENGYDAVTVEDIAERADVARATFYAHYDDKEQLLTALFQELTVELTLRLTNVEGGPIENLRINIIRDLYAHAAQFRDLYLVCLRGAGNGQARSAYSDVIASRAEVLFADRVRFEKRDSEVSLHTLSRAFAGAHVSLLEEWLEVGDFSNLDAAVLTQMELITKGFAWALHIAPDEVDAAFPKS